MANKVLFQFKSSYKMVSNLSNSYLGSFCECPVIKLAFILLVLFAFHYSWLPNNSQPPLSWTKIDFPWILVIHLTTFSLINSNSQQLKPSLTQTSYISLQVIQSTVPSLFYILFSPANKYITEGGKLIQILWKLNKRVWQGIKAIASCRPVHL